MRASYWQREASWDDRWKQAALPGKCDFAVIGGGISGLCTAIELRKENPSAEILLLESERIGYGASGRNAGFLSPVAAPVWLLGAESCPEQAWGIKALNEAMHSAAAWVGQELPSSELRPARLRLDATSLLSDCGLREFAHALEVSDLEFRQASARAHPDRLSIQMDAYMVHPYRMVSALAQHAVDSGIQILEGRRVSRVSSSAEGALLTLRGGETLRANKVVVCTNAYTSMLDLGERIPALVVHSFMLASSPLSASEQRAIDHDDDFSVELSSSQPYHRLHRDRVLYGAMDKFFTPRGGEFAVPERVRARLEEQMHLSFPELPALRAAQAWSGRFHATANGLPILRGCRRNPAVTLNIGYGGTGVALGLVCAPLVAKLASDSGRLCESEARLLRLIQETRLPLLHSLRALGRLARRLATPWR